MTFYNASHSRFLFQVLIPICVCSVHVSDVKVIQHLCQGDLRRPSVLVIVLVDGHVPGIVLLDVDELPHVCVLLNVLHEADVLVVAALRVHVRQTLHPLQPPAPLPVPDCLVSITSLNKNQQIGSMLDL